jgi:serine/threonine protein kinase
MTTRDPRDPRFARVGRDEAAQARDPTAPLSVDIDPLDRADVSGAHPSIALGTAGDERTRMESPNARQPRPERATSKPPPIPRTSDDPDLRVGAVLGTYRLGELLGKGGMGYVYRAEHIKLGREVALKLLRADYARRRDAVNRFFQEAKTVNRVRHRNIVDVTDFVELDDGTTFIIMELLRGQSLGKWARTGIDLPRALAVLVQICDGLGAAHAVGVIHRDLKPDNVIVTPTSDGGELVKLLDFGVAKLVNRDDEDIGFQTAAGSVIGTPAYMSPEQAGGMAVDQRSDIYSLGAIMYELFCGQPLFRGRSFGEYVRKHLTEVPTPPRQTQGGGGMHEMLEALILRCLAKEPSERFGHILELRDGLLRLLGGTETFLPLAVQSGTTQPSGMRPLSTGGALLPISQLPLAPPMQSTVPTPPHSSGYSSSLHGTASGPQQMLHSQSHHYSALPPLRTPIWPWIAGGAVAVGLGITAAVWYSGRGDEPKAATPPTVVTMKTEPIVTPQLPVMPPTALLELRFDSLPSGGVYADGHSAELCRTPCSFNVDLGDGGSKDQRTFVVRSDGYIDKPVVIDLTGPQREFHVTLDRPSVADETPPVVATPSRKPAKSKKSTKTHADDPDAAPEPPPPTTRPKDDDLEKPDPPTPSKEPIIDPADTHDPFHRKH